MKSFLKRFAPAPILVLAVFFTSVNGQALESETVIIDNNRHYAAYQVEGENVIFVLEMVDDFTDEIYGYFPSADFVSLRVDVNQNAEIDKYIDTSYGLTGKTYGRPDGARRSICTQYLIADYSSSVCGWLKSRATLDFGFRASIKETRPHPVYKFTIPKKELSKNGNSAQIRLRFHSSGSGYEVYPAKEAGEVYNSLAKTLTINF